MRVVRRTYGIGFTLKISQFEMMKVYEETTVELQEGDDPREVDLALRAMVDDKMAEHLNAEFEIIRKPIDKAGESS